MWDDLHLGGRDQWYFLEDKIEMIFSQFFEALPEEFCKLIKDSRCGDADEINEAIEQLKGKTVPTGQGNNVAGPDSKVSTVVEQGKKTHPVMKGKSLTHPAMLSFGQAQKVCEASPSKKRNRNKTKKGKQKK
eukprot:GHVQ01031142.1.p2 GENE.GHVQ01031142.1~~GHVQ01031142.1.p2  ORF type:complete len:132 (-),score=25.48 GHVQ01031142.1:2656-3051(-)